MDKNYFSGTPVKISTGLSRDYQEWIEKNHIPKILQTNCFKEKTQKFLDTETHPGIHVLTYINFPKSKEHWEAYNKTPELRPILKKEWEDRWLSEVGKNIFPMKEVFHTGEYSEV